MRRLFGMTWHKMYNPRWRKARVAFLAQHPECVDCGQTATDVDHDPPHLGDSAAFWDTSTWWPRCHSCHSRQTTRRDGHGFGHAKPNKPNMPNVAKMPSTRVNQW